MNKFDSNVGANHNNQVNPFLVSAEEKTIFKFKPRLWGEFNTSEDFMFVVDVLERAGEEDLVELHVCSNGGSADALSTLLNAMDKCQAPVHCVFTGGVSSAATFLLFHCDSFEIAPNTQFMFHEAIVSVYPQTHSAAKAQSDFTARWNERFIRETYTGFFNESELELLLQGKQWYMFEEEVLERMEKRMEFVEDQKANCDCSECTAERSVDLRTATDADFFEEHEEKYVDKLFKEDTDDSKYL